MKVAPAIAPTLAERARRLARPPSDRDTASAPAGLIRFTVAHEVFALPSSSVVAVRAAPRPAPVPRQPGWLAGMIGVRGRILPAIWLHDFLGTAGPSDPDDAPQRVLVLSSGETVVALIATAIEAVASPSAEQLSPLPAGSSARARRCGSAILGNCLVLDPVSLIEAIEEALSPTPRRSEGQAVSHVSNGESNADQT
jgi:purine-binding chemotaxis protein CheW